LPLDSLCQERDVALGNSLALSSHLVYDTALRSWAEFALLHKFAGIPTPDSLSLFIVWLSRSVSARTVESYLSGIVSKLLPICTDIRNIRQNEIVVRTLRGIKRRNGQTVVRKSALTENDLKIAVDSYSSPSYDDLLFLTILTVGFYSLQRLGELVQSDNRTLQDDRRFPRRLSVTVLPTHFEYLLPVHKADPFFEGNKIVVQRLSTSFDPYSLFLRYIEQRDRAFP
jgi:hypothetical protein